VATLGVADAPTSTSSSSSSSSSSSEEKKEVSDVPDSRTEKGGLAFSSTSCSRLDLFFKMVRGATNDELLPMFEGAWRENPEHLVQILLHARDCRSGKGERLVAYHGMLWLRKNKPLTYLNNLLTFLGHGYFKDLLNLAETVEKEKLAKLGEKDSVELELLAEFLKDDYERFTAGAKAKEEKAAAAAAAEAAGEEKEKEKDKPVRITLAAKWAPTEGSHFDKTHKLAKRLAYLVCRKDKEDDSTSTTIPGVTGVAPLKAYRKILSELRAHLNVTERLACAKEWDKINFATVPSKCHKILKKAFMKHANEKYQNYLAKLTRGEVKINSTGLMPHELAKDYLHGNNAVDLTTEGQWNDMVAKLKAAGGLSNAVSVCDVSGSMSGIPMDVAIALGIITSELTAPPFGGRIITFHEQPTWHSVVGDTLKAKVDCLKNAPWGMSTNFAGVFDMILTVALENKLKQADLPKTLFVFTDMQFDAAFQSGGVSTNQLRSVVQTIQDKWKKHNYQVPNLVFWNLRATPSKSFPVTMDTPGVALVSGYSAEILKIFMDGGDLSPMSVLFKAISPYTAVIEEAER